MLVQITKRADGAGLLRCVRDDGSATWQKLPERHASHFAYHDLTHFAVETTLGYTQGFFGLVAGGWDIEDTTGKGSRGSLPPEAGEVEGLVGLLDTERASVVQWTEEELREFGGSAGARVRMDDLAAIRMRRNELFLEWFNVPVGGVLELQFPNHL